jgi:MFS family permease
MRGRYQGCFTFTFSAAALVAPIGGGWVYDHLGQTTLWVSCGAISLAAALGHLLAGPARDRRLAALRTPTSPHMEQMTPADRVPVPDV